MTRPPRGLVDPTLTGLAHTQLTRLQQRTCNVASFVEAIGGHCMKRRFSKQVLHEAKINFSKSMLVPINLPVDQASILAASFGCELGKLPFTYLGLPFGLTKPKIVDFLPLVNKCERRLSCTSSLLSQAGRLEVTNSIFTALPMFFMCTFKLHKTVIEQVDKY